MPIYNTQYIEKWIRYLNDTDRDMSRMAAEKLGDTMDTTVVPELINTLANRPDDIRLAAVRSLGKIGDRKAVKPLIKLLDDMNPMIASTAADALGQIGDDSAVPALRDILSTYKNNLGRHNQIHGQNRGLFMAAVYALQAINTPAARSAVDRYYR